MTDHIIKTQHLTMAYGKKAAIDRMSININEGGIIGLIGRNGSGKTTFMKLIAGLLHKTGGHLEVFGGDPVKDLRVTEQLIYSYHNIPNPIFLTLQGIIANYKVMFRNFDEGFALRLLKYFNLKPAARIGKLSLGMASIFNFICALSSRADLTMLDEPVLGMEVAVRKSVYEVLLRDYAEYPRTIMISSHLLGELEPFLSEIMLIDEGKLVFYKDIDEMREMAYRIDGSKEAVDRFSLGREIINSRSNDLNSYAIISGCINDNVLNDGKQAEVVISKVRPEDLYVYMTRGNREEDLECLWK